jgi:hypothetical protein
MPFIHNISGDQDHFGTLRVLPDENTIYIINNNQKQGAEGLSSLDDPAYANAPMLVLGQFKTQPNRMEAQEVYVGSSVPGGTGDVVNGNVISRSGNIITVHGASLVRSTSQLNFCNTVRVTLDGNTVVSKQFSKDNLDIDAISVGQRIVVFGSAGELDGAGNLTITAKAARMMITHLRGIVQSNNTNPMVMELGAIDCRKPGDFSFTDVYADPDNYEVDTSASLAFGSRVKVWGFVNSYNHAPAEADFKSQTVINISTIPGFLHANWKMQGYEKAFTSTSANGLELYLAQNKLGIFHFLCRADVVDNLATDFGSKPIVITARDEGAAFFCIAQGLYFRPYTDFGEFAYELTDFINKGGDVRYITALGLFNDGQATMKAGWIVVRFAL